MRNNLKKNLLVIITGLVISLLYASPDIIGYLKSNKDFTYIGNSFLWDPWDVNVYVSVIKFSQIHGFQYKNPYTTLETQNNVVVYPLYTLLGTLFKYANPYVLYNLAIILFIPILTTSIFFTTFLITKSFKKAYFTVLISSFAGGFGWLLNDFGISVPDVSVTPFVLANVFQRPHTILALSAYVSSLGFCYAAIVNRERINLIFSFMFALIFILFYPYLLLSYGLTIFLFSLLHSLHVSKPKEFRGPLIYLFILSLLGGVYSYYLLSAQGLDNVFSPDLPTPGIHLFILGIGVFTVSFFKYIKKYFQDSIFLFIYTWFSVHVFIAYIPHLGFARYYFLGIFIPLTIVLLYFLESLSKKYKVFTTTLFIIFASLSCLFILIIRIVSVLKINGAYFWNRDEISAINFIRNNIESNDGIISTYPFSNFLPALSDNSVYFGHFYQTPRSQDKIELMTRFFNNKMDESEAMSFLASNNIDYVVWKNERIKWHNFPKLDKPDYKTLSKIFTNNEVTIWKVD